MLNSAQLGVHGLHFAEAQDVMDQRAWSLPQVVEAPPQLPLHGRVGDFSLSSPVSQQQREKLSAACRGVAVSQGV